MGKAIRLGLLVGLFVLGVELGAPAQVVTGNVCYLTSAASPNATMCRSVPTMVSDMTAVNTTATLYYLRMYDLAATPNCASATGFVESIPVPASATGAGVVRTFPMGHWFATGLGFCLTGGGGSTDNTNAATGVYISIGYK